MMKKIFVTVLLLFFVIPLSYGQRNKASRVEKIRPVVAGKREFTDSARRAITGMMLYPSWIMGSNRVLYTTTAADGLKTFWIADADAGRTIRLFDGREYAELVAPFTERTPDPMNPQFDIRRETEHGGVLCSAEGRSLILDLASVRFSLPDPSSAEKPRTYPDRPMWKRYTADDIYYIYGQAHNLFLGREGATGADSLVQLTRDGAADYSFITPGRNRYPDNQPQPWQGQWFGDTHTGYTLVADRRKVSTLTLVNSLANPAPRAVEYKFELPGDKYVTQYEMWLVYADSAKAVKADIAKFRDQEVKMVYGSGDPLDGVYFTRKNRVGDTLELCRLDPLTCMAKTLIAEASAPIWNDLLFSCTPFNGGREILWWSERTGKGAWYLYDGEGNLQNAVTDGSFVAGNIAHLDTGERYVIVEGYGYNKAGNPYYKRFFRVNLDGTGFTELTPAEGEHYMTMSLDRKYLIDRYSTVERMPRCEIRDMAGTLRLAIPMPDESLLAANGWHSPKLERVRTADNETDLFGIIYTPSDLDPSKKYPVICNVYPGPQVDNIPLSFSFEGGNNAALAEMGFIVLQFGYRGSSPLRGRDFYTYGHRNLRDYALVDCKHVVEALAAKYPYFDLDRVGIYGHSGGGMMSAAAIMTFPDFFKVAVASSGNHDNNIYGKFWTEAYNGVEPVASAGGLEFRSRAATNMELAPRLKGRLMLVTGDMDDNVHPANTIRLADALIRNNKKFDMMIIPGAPHEMGGTYYNYLIRSYFDRYLRNPGGFDADITATDL